MRTGSIIALLLTVSALGAHGQAVPAAGAAVAMDFSNPGISPSHWTLTLHPDGSGHFRSERGKADPGGSGQLDAGEVDRDIQLSARYAEQVFQTAQGHKRFNEECESHLKVAFQGWKKLSYAGPDGQGGCTYNYSKDKEIQALGDSLGAVAETLLEGSRLEMLLQHDRLGLDRETEYLVTAIKDGRAQQIGAIRGILERLAEDEGVLERVRKRARGLLAGAGTN